MCAVLNPVIVLIPTRPRGWSRRAWISGLSVLETRPNAVLLGSPLGFKRI